MMVELTPEDRPDVPKPASADPGAARFLTAAAAKDCPKLAKRALPHEVPIIDLQPFFIEPPSQADQDLVASLVAGACEEVGFFVIIGHGIDVGLLRACAAEGRAFFAQAASEREGVQANGRAYGFFPMASEALGYNADVAKRPDLREAFSMGPQEPPPPGTGPADVVDFCYQATPWPLHGGLKEVMLKYYAEAGRLADDLLRIFARALQVEEDFFLSKTTHHASSLRVIHYPKLDAEALPGQLRCGEHSDICTMTLLWQDVRGGLQVLPRGCDEWMEVSCPEEGLIVNLGDLFARWTNDRWLSTPHRVVCPRVSDADENISRISMPYFQIINSDAEVRCIESCLLRGEEPKHKPTTQGQDLMGHFKRWGRNR